MDGTETLNQEPEVVDDDRLNELASKEERTEEENKEFETLRVNKDKANTKSRIDDLIWKAKSAEEKLAEREAEIERLRQEQEELSKKPTEPPPLRKETITAGNVSFYTDASLQDMVNKKEITLEQANAHRDDRLLALAEDRAHKRLLKDQEEAQKQRQVETDTQEILAKYPHWNNKSRDFNANDPMMNTFGDLVKDGLSLKKAMATAERLHGVNKPHLDNSVNLTVASPSAPASQTKEDVEQPLTEDEKELAVRQWRNSTNPKTGRLYTENESIIKFQEARRRRRRT